jgi:hypothetical protein
VEVQLHSFISALDGDERPTLLPRKISRYTLNGRLKKPQGWSQSVGVFWVLLLIDWSKNVNSKIYRTIILRVVLYGFKTWSLTLREASWLRVFENRVLRRIFEPKRDEIRGTGEDYITWSFMLCTPDQISFE